MAAGPLEELTAITCTIQLQLYSTCSHLVRFSQLGALWSIMYGPHCSSDNIHYSMSVRIFNHRSAWAGRV